MKTRIIDYTPTLEKQLLAKRINDMRKTKTHQNIAEELGYSKSYILALDRWYRENVKGEKHA